MTKKEIAKKIGDATGIPRMTVTKIVQMIFDGITEILVEEGNIELRNFGVFKAKERKARKARNPRTGETVMVPARRKVTFKPGREMLKRVGEMMAENEVLPVAGRK
jgi:integration host factor subunit beta